MFSYFTRSSFTVTYLIAIIVCTSLVSQVENKSVFGIGTRVAGDGLLLKDVLHTPPMSLTEEPVIKFNYILVEPITYIKIESDKNVNAVVNFSYENDLIEGTISSINEQQAGEYTKPEPFEVQIQIYGFSDTMRNVNPALILNKNQEFDGVLKPKSLNLMQESLTDLYPDNQGTIGVEDDETDDDDTGDNYMDYDFNDYNDKIIEQGQRQEGDFLVYETSQTSATSSSMPLNHSITFYYIDIYYITYVKFTIFEHYFDNPLEKEDYVPPVVEYGHISPTTLKAVVTDHRTTSLLVKMEMYGFHPTQLPVDYKPFLSNGQRMLTTTTAASASASASASTFESATTRPISSLRQLKLLMNAQQQQQQQQGHQEEQPNELHQQISPGNNGPVNCLEQVLKSSISTLSASPSSLPAQTSVDDAGNAENATNASGSSRSIARWAIFNLIVTIFVALVSV